MVVGYDAQSELSKYTQFAQTAVLRDGIAAMFAGLTSSSREAIRPIFREANIPYFYSSLYEGGACDKQTFVTGSSASQQLSVLMEWAVENYGPRIYIMAPDYNFGTISGHWVREYAKQLGAEVVGEDYLALSVTDYAPTIQKIQASNPDVVVALPGYLPYATSDFCAHISGKQTRVISEREEACAVTTRFNITALTRRDRRRRKLSALRLHTCHPSIGDMRVIDV